MRTVYGRLAGRLGHSTAAGRFWARPAGDYLPTQNAEIPIDRDHDSRAVGSVAFLARSGGSIWAVGEVDDAVTESVRVRVDSRVGEVASPLYWSATTIGGGEDGVLLTSVALTAPPARVCAPAVSFLPGSLDHGRAAERWRSRLDRAEFAPLDRAAHARAERRRGDPITIAELDQPKLTKLGRSDHWIDGTGEPVGRFRRQPELPDEHRSPGQWRIRPCGPILSVR